MRKNLLSSVRLLWEWGCKKHREKSYFLLIYGRNEAAFVVWIESVAFNRVFYL
mgnify:CR=1 FL=1